MTTDRPSSTASSTPTTDAPAPTPISTPEDGLEVGWSTVIADGGQLPLYYARPQVISASQPRMLPLMLVIQEIFGVHEHIRDVARRLARLGYLAVVPDLFFRHGDATRIKDIEALRRDFVAKTDDAHVLDDCDRALGWGETHGGDPQRVALTGFCWGGRIAWLYAAHQPRVTAAVAWYGRLSGEKTPLQPQHPLDVIHTLRVPVLGLYGGQDPSIPLSSVETFRAALRAAKTPSEVYVYADAGHAFFADYRSNYRPAAAADGWRRMIQWLSQHGVS